MQTVAEILRQITEAPLGTDQATAIAREIANAVRDPKLAPSVIMRAARAVVDRRMEAQELGDILDGIIATHARCPGGGAFTTGPGAYFVFCLKRAFQRNEIPWNAPTAPRPPRPDSPLWRFGNP